MVASLMLHPFRLSTAGHVVCAEQGSDAYLESQVRVVIETHIGEREMALPFGVPDPTFAQLSIDDVQTCLDLYGPDDIIITAVTPVQRGDLTTDYTVAWRRAATT